MAAWSARRLTAAAAPARPPARMRMQRPPTWAVTSSRLRYNNAGVAGNMLCRPGRAPGSSIRPTARPLCALPPEVAPKER